MKSTYHPANNDSNTLRADIVGGLAVHSIADNGGIGFVQSFGRHIRGWTLAHAPSGNVLCRVAHRKQARRLREYLLRRFDWTQSAARVVTTIPTELKELIEYAGGCWRNCHLSGCGDTSFRAGYLMHLLMDVEHLPAGASVVIEAGASASERKTIAWADSARAAIWVERNRYSAEVAAELQA